MSIAYADSEEIIGAQRPRMESLAPASSYSLGEDAVEFAAKSGLYLDDWQSYAITRSMGTRPNGKWAAFEVCWIIPRQNGKNSMLEARQLAGLFVTREALQIHTAHEFKACSEHFRRMRITIESSSNLMRKVAQIRTSHGDEAIELRPSPTLIFGPRNTQIRKSVAPRLRFLARSRGSGRAFTADAVYYDEAMILAAEDVDASMPTMSAVPNPQMWFTASAGFPDSTQLAAVRRRGIKGWMDAAKMDPSLTFGEWSCELCPDLCPHKNQPTCPLGHDRRDDPRSWARANPGMNIRLSQEHIGREFIKMNSTGFDRERLGLGEWPSEDESWSVISEHDWDACVWDEEYQGSPVRPKRVALCVDITPDQSAACIAVAGMLAPQPKHPEDPASTETVQRILVEIAKNAEGVLDHRAGTDWIVPRLREWKARHGQRICAIVIDPIGPGNELITKLEAEGFDWHRPGQEGLLKKTTLRDVAGAHGQILRDISERMIFHLNQQNLRQAVAAGVQRDVGDGQHAWARKDTEYDISPLCSMTLAVWGAKKYGGGYDVLKSVL